MKIVFILLFLSNFAISFASDYYQPAPGDSDSEITSVIKCFRQYIQTTHKGHLKELRIKNKIMEILRTPDKNFVFVISKKTDVWFLTKYNLNTNVVDTIKFQNQIIVDRLTNDRLIFHEKLEFNFNFYVLNLTEQIWIYKDVPSLYTISPDNSFLAYVTKKNHRSESSIYFHDLTKEQNTFCFLPFSTTSGAILPGFEHDNKCTITFRNNSVDDNDDKSIEITKDEINNLFTLSDRNAHNYLRKKYKSKN